VHLGRKLTLISAAAGFGKTTLLTDWIHHRRGAVSPPSEDGVTGTGGETPPLRVAWVSLDEGDNDPTRFLAYVVAALQSFDPHIGEGGLIALRSPQPPPLETVLTSLINELAALPADGGDEGPPGKRKGCPYVVVLDDYHVIEVQPIHAALTFLLDHLPPQLHLAMATRADPPLPLARLRVRGELTELRAADLRFTSEEAAAFLNEVMGLPLSPQEIAALEGRTEGWIAGLQVAALSMQGREDTASFVKSFTGSHRYILDYLVEEVVERQPERVQSFLLQTAVLDRLTAPLCDAVWDEFVNLMRDRPREAAREPEPGPVVGAPFDSQSMLETLEQANLFLVPLDDERRWYRYHRLFGDILSARLGQQVGREGVAALHRRAAGWYEEQGALEEAIKHGLAGNDAAHVARLLEQHGTAMLMRGTLAPLHRWLALLGEGVVRDSPYLCVLHAWVLLLTGDWAEIETRLQRAEELWSSAPAAGPVSDLPGHVAAIRSYMAGQRVDLPATIELANQALDLLDPQNLGIRAVVTFVLGGAYLTRGEVAAAAEAMAQAGDLGQRGGNPHLAVPALNALASIRMQQGDLRQAQETASQALRLGTSSSGTLLPIAAGALSGLAELALERNDLQTAQAQAQASVDLGEQWGNSDTLCSNYLMLAEVLLTLGDRTAARDALRKAEQVACSLAVTPQLVRYVRAGWARLHLAEGDLSALEDWLRELGSEQAGTAYPAEAMALARVRLALGQHEEALRALVPLLEQLRAQGLAGMVAKGRTLEAMIHQAAGAEERALVALAEALALAEAQGYVRFFLDYGPPMARLLRKAAKRGIARDYVGRLLAQSGRQAGEDGQQVAGSAPSIVFGLSSLVEPLSNRELEVLRLVAAGLSNQQIAQKLFIAVSTVKSHLNSVYGKLGVKNRTQAVARARELDLL
jgi:LuxR family maltose regulon positive regulatory protein